MAISFHRNTFLLNLGFYKLTFTGHQDTVIALFKWKIPEPVSWLYQTLSFQGFKYHRLVGMKAEFKIRWTVSFEPSF